MPGNEKREKEIEAEVAGIVGGVARRVPGPAGRPSDSMLAVYKDRVTYTFILEKEVASIHFDQRRQEIFFRGHNLRFMELEPAEEQACRDLALILEHDREGCRFISVYRETLARLLADK